MGTLQLLSRTWGPGPPSKYFQTHIWQASSFSDYDHQLIFSLQPPLPFYFCPLFPLFSCVNNIQHTFLSLYLRLHKGKASPPSLNKIISSGGLATWNIKHKAILTGATVVSGRTANSILLGTSLVVVLNPPAGWEVFLSHVDHRIKSNDWKKRKIQRPECVNSEGEKKSGNQN